MREPGVGPRGGLTDWYLMNVADMWACLQDHQTDHHWRHVAGWRKVCDLAGQHLDRLRTYRDGLARAWPPETSAAARVYLAELDDLIEQVQHTHDAAAANQSALSAATQALTSTRTELKRIYDEYASKLQQKRAWDETAADPKAAAGSRTSQPPVTDTDLERLNIQARGIMYGLSGELQQAQVMLRQPPPAAPVARQPSDPDAYGGAAGTPVIPPIVPVAIRSPNKSAGKRPTSPVRLAPSPKTPQIGPVLGRAEPALGPNSSNSRAPGTPQVMPNVPSPGIGIPPAPPPAGPGGRPDSARPAQNRPGQIGHPVARGGTRASLPNSGNSPRALPPGGVIGGIPGVGPTQPGSGSTQPRRTNPIGGVIGGGAAGTAPGGAAGSRPRGGRVFNGMQPPSTFGGIPRPGAAGAAETIGAWKDPDQGDCADQQRRWDPDDPWVTDQGVSPVVRPPDEDGPIDPGPAIGFNR
ncbi:hypothetical protein GCM10011608_54850 [Micromonospora sonchi]|uniref:Uncharacterized protein n=1 Tax=Micromonospora sonchi TaxID=1763543 RepID=A0A917X401_9ACTN|nr:hypothetical protein GCM10011608_54850 [Micromonospora sonchi]